MALEAVLHVVPVGDLIEHDITGEPCVCGPDKQWTIGSTGTVGYMVVHHSLDGRELEEQDHGAPN